MAARMHGYLQEGKKQPDPEQSNKKRREKGTPDRRKGWTKKSNQEYIAQLQAEDREHKTRHGKNSGKRCDKCIMEEHDLCWRVVCYCPCYKEWNNAQPYRTVVLGGGDSSDLE